MFVLGCVAVCIRIELVKRVRSHISGHRRGKTWNAQGGSLFLGRDGNRGTGEVLVSWEDGGGRNWALEEMGECGDSRG